MSLTLMCGLFCLAFTFDNTQMHWLWADTQPVAVILAAATIILGIFWFKSFKQLKAER